jgi:hypothetical protein
MSSVGEAPFPSPAADGCLPPLAPFLSALPDDSRMGVSYLTSECSACTMLRPEHTTHQASSQGSKVPPCLRSAGLEHPSPGAAADGRVDLFMIKPVDVNLKHQAARLYGHCWALGRLGAQPATAPYCPSHRRTLQGTMRYHTSDDQRLHAIRGQAGKASNAVPDRLNGRFLGDQIERCSTDPEVPVLCMAKRNIGPLLHLQPLAVGGTRTNFQVIRQLDPRSTLTTTQSLQDHPNPCQNACNV